MLNKLVKQEMKSTGSIMFFVYGVFVIATVLACISGFWKRHANDSFSEGIWSVVFIAYVITLVILMAASLIYLCWKFYYTMYSTQGYLTHTLPVKPSWTLNCKILVSALYFLITSILCAASMSITGAVVTGDGFHVIWEVIKTTVSEGAGVFGLNQAAFVVLLAAMMCLAILNYLLMFFAGSSIGQLFKRSKGAAGIAAGIGLYYASQIVAVILIVIGYTFFRRFTSPEKVVLILALALEALWTCVYYMISRVILLRHLNLE